MTDEITLKRLRMRSSRRGMKEMDLILGSFSATELAQSDADDLALYEDMLSENDQDLYNWVSGRDPAPARYAGLIDRIASHAQGVAAPDRSA